MPNNLNSQTCQDFTLDNCFFDEGGLIESFKDIDETTCQMFCDLIYTEECNFFLYERKHVVCGLFRKSPDDYLNSCKIFGGPSNPSVDSCKESSDPCKGFLEGYCRYQGDLLKHLEGLSSLSKCQDTCFLFPGCQYFVYKIETKDCEL